MSVNEMKKIFPPAMTSPQVWISFMLATTDFVQRTQDFPDFYIALVLTQFHRQRNRQTDRSGTYNNPVFLVLTSLPWFQKLIDSFCSLSILSLHRLTT